MDCRQLKKESFSYPSRLSLPQHVARALSLSPRIHSLRKSFLSFSARARSPNPPPSPLAPTIKPPFELQLPRLPSPPSSFSSLKELIPVSTEFSSQASPASYTPTNTNYLQAFSYPHQSQSPPNRHHALQPGNSLPPIPSRFIPPTPVPSTSSHFISSPHTSQIQSTPR